jgi:cytochrome c biogenesis protein CcdA
MRTWCYALALQNLYGLLSFVNPIILPYMATYIADPSVPYWYGLMYTAIILVVSVFASVCYYQSWFTGATIGVQVALEVSLY